MVNISQTFVTYHGCGNGYYDGTRKFFPKIRKSIKPTYDPFGKNQSMFVTKLKLKHNL